MAGHGSPPTSRGPRGPCARNGAPWGPRRLALCALGALLTFLPCAARAADESMRIRIAWGGGSERIWQGSVALSEGTISAPQALGIEADEPGSMFLEADAERGNQRLVIRQRSSRSYDGVDVLLSAPLQAKLSIQLAAADDPQHPFALEVPLGSLVGELQNREIDKQGNRILIHRAPGDLLRVDIERSSLVFAPGETFRFSLEPNLLPLPPGSRVQIKVQLSPAQSQKELWSTQQNIQTGQAASIPIEVPLAAEEGAYDVSIAAVHTPNWQQAVRQPLNWKKTVAERSVQVLVLGAHRPAAGRPDRELTTVATIEPANPKWWDVAAKLPKIPGLSNAPLGNGHSRTWKHPLGEMVRLDPSAESPDVSWEAYSLPINQPGRPHVLEVEYPSDVPQTLGISILEPNAAGSLVPIALDSGVDVAPEPAGTAHAAHAQAPADLLAADDAPAAADQQPPRSCAGRLRQDSRAGRLGAAAGGRRVATATGPTAHGGLFRPAVVPRELRRQRSRRRLERPQPRRLAHVLRGRHAAGRVLCTTSATTA